MYNKNKVKKTIYILIFIISIVLLLVSLVNIIKILKEYKDANNLYAQMQDYVHVETGDLFDNSNISNNNDKPTNDTSDHIADEHDISDDDHQLTIDFDRLHEINQDIIGWIYFDDDTINYPIVQADDNDFYLRRTVTGESNNAGSIFIDYKNSADLSDYNTFIYGHNMRDGSMFAFLNQYLDRDNYKLYPNFWIVTPQGQYQYEIFSCYKTDPSSDSFRIGFYSQDDYANYLDHIKDLSIYDTEVDVNSSDNIITLSTCVYRDNTRRLLVHAKRVID